MKLSKAAIFGAIGAVAAELFWRMAQNANVANKNVPFYACPVVGCNFSVASSNEAIVKRDRVEHEGWHAGGSR